MDKSLKTIRSLEDLEKYREQILAERAQQAETPGIHITVGLGTCGIAAGATDVIRMLAEKIQEHDLQNIVITPTGCIGLCAHEPIVEVTVGAEPKVTYGRVSVEGAVRIIQDHIIGGKIVDELVIDTTPFPTI
ncbi:MAG TPA: (2Fe-2S) ferredoxin domain-containing protein [Anaerolineales bacterium]